jgi:hypothetical protein
LNITGEVKHGYIKNRHDLISMKPDPQKAFVVPYFECFSMKEMERQMAVLLIFSKNSDRSPVNLRPTPSLIRDTQL